MITVCHLTVAHPPADTRIFEKECKSLLKKGYRVLLIAPNTKDQTINGVEIYGVNIFNKNPLYRVFFGARKIYKKARELDADIYHFHDIELFKYGIKLKKAGKKVIFDSHENWLGYAKSIKWLPRIIRNFLAYKIRRQYACHLSEFDAVIGTSPHIVNNLSQYASKVYMITNYPIIDPESLPNLNAEEYANRKNTLCYAGTVYSESNQEATIKAVNSLNTIQYNIVGNISEKEKSRLSTIADKGKINFINTVPAKELHKIYQSSIAGMVVFDYAPNLGYKMGTLGSNKMFEYMLFGLPIISSDQDLWKNEIVEKYNCGICVRPGNSIDIKNAIQKLIQNKNAAFKMGINGRNAILKEFNWKTQEKILFNIYDSIIERKYE